MYGKPSYDELAAAVSACAEWMTPAGPLSNAAGVATGIIPLAARLEEAKRASLIADALANEDETYISYMEEGAYHEMDFDAFAEMRGGDER